nr:hypothetical protein [Tanacetum cinerariifolium]
MEAGGKDRPLMLAPGSSETTIEGYVENYKNVSQDIRNQLDVEAEVVQIILTGIDNYIYSTVDACPNVPQDYNTSSVVPCLFIHILCYSVSLYLFTERYAQPYFFSCLIQQKPEPAVVTSISAAVTSTALKSLLNPTKIYKPTNNNLKTSSNTSIANQDNNPRINKGTGYNNQRVVNVAKARENVGAQVMQQSRIQCYNCKECSQVARECQKPKRAKDAAYHKDKCYCVQNDADKYNVFANDRQHLEQPEFVNDTYLEEQGDINITIDSLDMSTNGETVDEDDNDLARERDLLAF